MSESEKHLPSPPTPEQLQTAAESRTTSQDLINAAKRMSLEEKKSFLMNLIDADEKTIEFASRNQKLPEQEKELISDQDWNDRLKNVWDNFGEALEPVEKIATILTFFLAIGWVKPLPSQTVVDPQKTESVTLVHKPISLEGSREGGFGKGDLLRKQVEDLLIREASGEISEQEFHDIYDELLQVHSPSSVTLKSIPQEYGEQIENITPQIYEVELSLFSQKDNKELF